MGIGVLFAVKMPQPHGYHYLAADGFVQIVFADQAQGQRFPGCLLHHHRVIAHAVHTGFQRSGHRFGMVAEMVLAGDHQVQRSAVAHRMGQAVLAFQNIGHIVIENAHLAVDAVIGGHYPLYSGFFNAAAEGLQIKLIFVPGVNGSVFPGPAGFGIVGIKMLQGGGAADVFFILALHAPNVGPGQLADEKRVFAVGFFMAAPSGIPLQVHRGCPAAQPPAVFALGHHPGLYPYDLTALLHHLFIPAAAHADGLGEGGGDIRLGNEALVVAPLYTVGSLGPQAKGQHPQPFAGRKPGGYPTAFFIRRQLGQQPFRSFFKGKGNIE